MKKLDTLYSNPKYSELDLGQALHLVVAEELEHRPDNDATAPVPSASPAQSVAPEPAHRSMK